MGMILSYCERGILVVEDNGNNQMSQLPDHVAIIMDGNGRWAKEYGMKRSDGHEEGMEAIRRVTRKAYERNIKVLTLYAFSTENWKRPLSEVNFLMNLPIRFFDTFVPELVENNVKVTSMGFEKKIPSATKKAIERAIEKTKDNTGMVLNIAFNYGGRSEITQSVKTIAQLVKKGELKEKDITEELVSEHLFTSPLKPYDNVDLLIRTSGEQRLSNFLLWQNAYSEFYFSQHYWPDFNGDLFDEALLNYQNRNRRYGGV